MTENADSDAPLWKEIRFCEGREGSLEDRSNLVHIGSTFTQGTFMQNALEAS